MGSKQSKKIQGATITKLTWTRLLNVNHVCSTFQMKFAYDKRASSINGWNNRTNFAECVNKEREGKKAQNKKEEIRKYFFPQRKPFRWLFCVLNVKQETNFYHGNGLFFTHIPYLQMMIMVLSTHFVCNDKFQFG